MNAIARAAIVLSFLSGCASARMNNYPSASPSERMLCRDDARQAYVTTAMGLTSVSTDVDADKYNECMDALGFERGPGTGSFERVETW